MVNPTKVTIIEALLYMDRPLSAAETSRMLGDAKLKLSHIAYHMSWRKSKVRAAAA